MTRDEAYDIYNTIRLQFPKREIPDSNFEGCEWFALPNGIHGRDSKGKIMLVLTHGVVVIDKGTMVGRIFWSPRAEVDNCDVVIPPFGAAMLGH